MSHLFDTAQKLAAFPILAVARDGRVLDKNKAAEKHLPALRRGCSLLRRLKCASALERGGVVTLSDPAVYHRAVIFEGENCLYLLFLGRLQFPDGEESAKALALQTGGAFPSLPSEATALREDNLSPRLCRELLLAAAPEEGDPSGLLPFDRLWNELLRRTRVGFSVLGYRVWARRAEPCPSERLIALSPCTFSYLVTAMLYILMKHSEKGVLYLNAPWDDTPRRRLVFATRTALSPKKVNGLDTKAALLALAPELAAELALLPRGDELLSRLLLYVDSYGKLCLEYDLPYSPVPSALTLRSTGKRQKYSAALRPILPLLSPLAKNG